MKAINYYLIVDRIKEAPKKVGGLELTEKQDSDIRYFKGEIISTGNLVEGIKDGDIVWYDRHAGHGIQFEDKLYYVLKAGDIVIVE